MTSAASARIPRPSPPGAVIAQVQTTRGAGDTTACAAS
jgi:hypothetical protein